MGVERSCMKLCGVLVTFCSVYQTKNDTLSVHVCMVLCVHSCVCVLVLESLVVMI